MKAIWTKYLPATNYKGSRIKAECESGSVTIPYDYSGNEHDQAAIALVKKMGWATRNDKPLSRTLLSGGRPDGRGNVYVFAESERIEVPADKPKPPTIGPCHCKRGRHRDNCPDCEGTGQRIDFKALRAGGAK